MADIYILWASKKPLRIASERLLAEREGFEPPEV